MIRRAMAGDVIRSGHRHLPQLSAQRNRDHILGDHLADPYGEIEACGDGILQVVVERNVQLDLRKLAAQAGQSRQDEFLAS